MQTQPEAGFEPVDTQGNASGDRATIRPVDNRFRNRTITLQQVRDAQRKLLDSIEQLTDAKLKQDLKDRVMADDKLIRESSNAALDDDQTSTLLDPNEKIKGLNHLQQKTRENFEAALRNSNQRELNERILNELIELNDLRANLFAQEHKKQTDTMVEEAKNALDLHLGGSLSGLRNAGRATPPGQITTLSEELQGLQETKLVSADKKTWVNSTNIPQYNPKTNELIGSVPGLESNDPVALGLSVAANRWEAATFNADDPDFALKAAMTALQNGVKNVKIHPNVRAIINTTQPRQYFYSPAEQADLKKRLAAFDKLYIESNTNDIFNDETAVGAIEKAFLSISQPETQKQFINTLSAKQKAQLAIDLQSHGKTVDGKSPIAFIRDSIDVTKTVTPGIINKIFANFKYVTDKDATAKAKAEFEKEIHAVAAKRVFKDIVNANPGNPKKIAEEMIKQSKDLTARDPSASKKQRPDLSKSLLRKELIAQIDTLPANMKNQVRAAYMSELFDLYDRNPDLYTPAKLDDQLRLLLASTSDADKVEIQRIFDTKFDHFRDDTSPGIEPIGANEVVQNENRYNQMCARAMQNHLRTAPAAAPAQPAPGLNAQPGANPPAPAPNAQPGANPPAPAPNAQPGANPPAPAPNAQPTTTTVPPSISFGNTNQGGLNNPVSNANDRNQGLDQNQDQQPTSAPGLGNRGNQP